MLLRPIRIGGISLAGVVLLLTLTQPAIADDQSERDDAALRDYLSANGLLNRGLYELAEKEYRQFLRAHESHAKAPIARYGLAVCLYRTEKFAAAVKELEPLTEVANFAFAAEVRAMLGQCHLALKDYPAAARACQELLRNHERNELADDAAALLIEAHYLGGEHEAALKQCTRFESRYRQSPLLERVLFFWGLASMALDDHAAGAERFAQLLERFPESRFAGQVPLLIAQCHHHEGALEEAMRWYRRALDHATGDQTSDALFGLATLVHKRGDTREAGVLLDRLLQENPPDALVAPASLLRGRVWFEQGDYARAAELFARVEEAEGELAAQAAYWLAKCRLRAGDFTDAARRLEQTLAQHGDSELLPEMRYDLGVAWAQAGDDEAALAALQTFLSQHAGHALAADALSLMATIEHNRGAFERSLAFCRQFLGDHRAHQLTPRVAFLAAEDSFLLGQYDDALRGYRAFLEKHANDPQAPQAGYRLGMTLFRLERFDEATPLLLEAAARGDGSFRACELALGEIYFAREAWKPAVEHLGKYLRNGPDAPSRDEALLKLGLAFERQGQQREARGAFERLLGECEQSPHRLHAIFERGQTLVALNELDQAVDAFEQVLAEGPDSRFVAFALNHLGSIATRRNQPERAADYFARVLAVDPSGDVETAALFQRGEALLATRDYRAAQQAFETLLQKHAESEQAPIAQARLAVTLARQDQPTEALQAIARAERQPAERLDAPTRVALQYEKAWCLRKLNRNEDAAAAYRELLKTGAEPALRAYALLGLAEIEADAKRYEPAVELLGQLQQILGAGEVEVAADVRAQTTYRLGVCLFELSRPDEAAAALEEFLSAFPDHALAASARYFCGEALLKTGKNGRAAEHLSRVVADFKQDPVYAPALLRLGECLAALQRWARSEEIFDEYLRAFADGEQWYQAMFGVGWARENQQRYDEALTAYRRVVEKHQGETAARAQFQIGECLFAQKRLDEATRELLKVDILYAYPEWSAAALFEAGRCFEELGKAVEARAQYRTVGEKHPKTRWAQLAAQRLGAVADGALPGGRNRDQ